MKRLLYLAIIFLPTAFAFGQGAACTTATGIRQNTFKCVVDFAASLVNGLVIIIFGIGLIVFIWGLLKYIAAAGDEAAIKEAKQFIVFGIIALAVMMSVWGLTNLLVGLFFPSGAALVIPQLK